MSCASVACIICVTILIQCQDITAASVLNKDATEPPLCSEGKFRCKNGQCVEELSRCNGTIECSDASDESFVLCRNDKCGEYQFRCAYGACVNGAGCDEVQHCADRSDELLFRCWDVKDRCRNTGQYITTWGKRVPVCELIGDKCYNGQKIPEGTLCDGKVECSDGSDETLSRCGEVKCKTDQFQCAYGGCIQLNAMCNGVDNCVDRTDESTELCEAMLQMTAKPDNEESTTLGPLYTSCVIPPQPENGRYMKYDGAPAIPGERMDSALLNYTCNYPYKLVGNQLIYCLNGIWSSEFPTCQSFCLLGKDQSVEYRCLLTGEGSVEGYRECNDEEPPGTTAMPMCRSPNFYSPEPLPLMICENGKWNHTPLCDSECGRATAKSTRLIAGGSEADADEIPWHVGVYRKTTQPYEQICGGSIISPKAIISAAHCFWNVTLSPASDFALAAGKLNRPWDDLNDEGLQRRDVMDIQIPERYQGEKTHYQDDIALLVVKKAFLFSVHVRPVCVHFGPEFNIRQLQPGNKGKVAGWGFTTEHGNTSSVLKVAELPYVSIEQCLEETPFDFKSYITSDKICAGYRNGTAVCKGDSGGGLSFPEVKEGIARYYLRGIVSTAPGSREWCNTRTITTFTHLQRHEHFITKYFDNYPVTGFKYIDFSKLANYNV